MREGLAKTSRNIAGKIETLIKGSSQLDDDFFEELEAILIQADLGMPTTTAIVKAVRRQVKEKKLTAPEQVREVLRDEIGAIMAGSGGSLIIAAEKPTVYLMVGVNGVGKTTSIAKLAYRFKREGKKIVLAAGDTFRAAASEQLQVWAERVGVDLVRHQEGADPAAVVFDAINAARARKADILIIDSAGRLQNKANLMEEIAKVRRIISREIPDAPHEVLLVLDATTGQNAISQARAFQEMTGVTGIILTKLDGTAKGGIVIAVAKELAIPVKLIGIGEAMEDLKDFDAAEFADALFPGQDD
ncbi:MAG: signal recognition particle-docking protein FtsY [Solirubrobacterales bacterium]